MRYIYLNIVMQIVTVCDVPSEEYGELIGTSSVWDHAKPTTKKFIIASMIQNSPHKGMTGIRIEDCDAPKPENPNQ